MEQAPKLQDEKADRLRYYEDLRRKQLGYSIHLILTLAVASLGFSLALVKDSDFTPGCWGKAFLCLSLLLLLSSSGLGIVAVVNRLRDFRKTALKIRKEADPDAAEEVRRLKEEAHRLGGITWILFGWQVGTFGVAVLSLSICLAVVYHSKLF